MQISSLDSIVLIPNTFEEAWQKVEKHCNTKKLFVVVDENTHKLCYPLVKDIEALAQAPVIEIPQGEENKSIETTAKVWKALCNHGADRQSLVINLGGGMLCDLAGFAASTFKRGAKFINIPTTLLAQVDASIGGKLGINFCGLKNEIGLFNTPEFVIIHTSFLKTLDNANFLSGYAEMIKHALIYSASYWKKIKQFDVQKAGIDSQQMKNLISKSIFIKNDFVQKDPNEKELRKALNFGHTVGHAIESFLIDEKRPVLHGIAVAYGMLAEAYLSHLKLALDKNDLEEISESIRRKYGTLKLEESSFEKLYQLMQHDKKNEQDKILFTLISEIGTVSINETCVKEQVFEALSYLKEQLS